MSVTKNIVGDTGVSPNTGRQKWNQMVDDVIDEAEGYLGPNNAIKYDKDGVGNPCVFIRRFNWDVSNGFNSSTIHPAFVVNGVEKPGFWIFKHKAVLIAANAAAAGERPTTTIYDDTSDPGHSHTYKARSVPGVKPRTHIDFDSARRACTNMNGGAVTGWHLMSNAEWAAVALLSKQTATMPYGNGNYGRDVDSKHVSGEIVAGDTFGSGTSRWKNGSGGPLTTHDRTQYGIFDLNGNIYEWVDGLKLNEGKIYVAGNLNTTPTDGGNSFAAAEADWFDTGIFINWDGVQTYFTFSAADRGTTMNGASPNYKTRAFGDLTGSPTDLLKKTAIAPVSGGAAAYGSDYMYARNFIERLPLRSGAWNIGTNAGIFHLSLSDPRTSVYNDVGFRAALIE